MQYHKRVMFDQKLREGWKIRIACWSWIILLDVIIEKFVKCIVL